MQSQILKLLIVSLCILIDFFWAIKLAACPAQCIFYFCILVLEYRKLTVSEEVTNVVDVIWLLIQCNCTVVLASGIFFVRPKTKFVLFMQSQQSVDVNKLVNDHFTAETIDYNCGNDRYSPTVQ